MKFCSKCGTSLADDAQFCSSCGTPCAAQNAESESKAGNASTTENNTPKSDKDTVSAAFNSFTDKISRMTGGSGAVRPPLKTLFSNIFTKHTPRESEDIFICGTESTQSELTDADTAWPRPWLWSRILLVFGIAFVLLHFCCVNFGNTNSFPGVIFLGAFAFPFAVLMFFFEANTPRNISFFTVLKYFLIGGCASLVVTLFLFDILNFDLDQYLDAILTGIIEETAKLAIVAAVIYKSPKIKYAINGILVGAAIGTGFAAFESAGYAFNIFLTAVFSSGSLSVAYSEMVENILLRGILSPGGHIAWAAIAGYAVMLVKGDAQLSVGFLNKKAFWKIFWIPIALHAVWDMPFSFGNSMAGAILFRLVLVVLAWIVLLVLIGNSLSQIGEILKKNKSALVPPAPQAEADTPTQPEQNNQNEKENE